MVHPLVGYNNRSLHFRKVGNGILGQYGKVIRSNQLRDAVVDFRITVVRTAGKDDTSVTGLFHPHKGFFSLFFNILSGLQKLFPGKMGCISDFLLRKIPLFKLFADFFDGPVPGRFHGIFNLLRVYKNLSQLIRKNLLIRKGEEGLHKENALFLEIFHIVFDIFRIGSYHGAIVVVSRARSFVSFVRNTRIENELLSLVNQPLDMSVNKLCGITLGLGGNGLDPHFVNLLVGRGGEHCTEAELLKENRPEGIIFVHV